MWASKVDTLERGVPEENVSGNGTPSMLQTAPGPMYEVAGQTVAAVLTLDRLPEGWEDVLGETPEWLTDEAGRPCCFITAAQLEGWLPWPSRRRAAARWRAKRIRTSSAPWCCLKDSDTL